VHVVIMGCGRVGSTLALSLTARSHSVAVIDQDAESFRRLGNDFEGARITGVGFDRDTLVMARIEEAGAFCAVSSGDNSNIIAARVARETFGIENVVARIYDPRRAQVYERLGIPTVATVRWTADQMLHRILPEGGHREWTDLSGRVVVAEVPFHHGWIGRRLRELERASGARVAFMTRYGEGTLPADDTVVQDGDLIHVIAAKDDLDRVGDAFAGQPGEH
jgi:trk system potassium uptake protein TrkA